MRIALVIGILALVAVVAVGMYVTDFTAYLGNDPTTCNNCHVMDNVYEGWYHGGHQKAAVCGDCHTPHALIPKYITKAVSGYHHVSAFILGNIPNAIRAKESSQKIIQANCIRCHGETVANLAIGQKDNDDGGVRFCFDCHQTTSHGRRGISILPYQHTEESNE